MRFRFLAAFILLASFLAAGGAHAQMPANAREPVGTFFQQAVITEARISPTGRHVALGVRAKNGRVQLVTLDTATPQNAKVVYGFSNGDIARFEWVNDDRLAFTVTDSRTAQGDTRFGPGLFAIDRDGGDFRQLAELEWNHERRVGQRELLNVNSRLAGTTHLQKSDEVFVVIPDFDDRWDLRSVVLAAVNARTGAVSRFNRPGNTFSWLLDTNDQARFVETAEGDKSIVFYMDPATRQWRKLQEFNRFTRAGAYRPVAIAPDGSVYVTTSPDGGPVSLHRFDVAKGAPDPEALISLKGFDFSGRFISDSRQLLGVRYVSDAESTLWIDPRMKEIQARLDKLMPGLVNTIDVPVRAEVPQYVVHSYSDQDPGSFELFDAESGKLVSLGRSQPAVDPRRMAQRDFIRYKARDGLEIPGWLTLPRGAAKGQKLPMVVLVHGGPWAHAPKWQFNPESQFLASRGYAVLEPDFRGSTGYGFQFFKAGWKQWGLKMQDDVADGAKWAISQGIADPQRICIAGASYGGYATLMGLLRDPGLFKCGVDWVGVTDLDLLYDIGWSDLSSDYKDYGIPLLVGDRNADAEQLKATSPLVQAAGIRQPLLLAYGGADRRVPIEHGLKFRDAVGKSNPSVEWVEYTSEGHGWLLPATNADFWTRVEKFLGRNIGTP